MLTCQVQKSRGFVKWKRKRERDRQRERRAEERDSLRDTANKENQSMLIASSSHEPWLVKWERQTERMTSEEYRK